jgi:hypothetical protein
MWLVVSCDGSLYNKEWRKIQLLHDLHLYLVCPDLLVAVDETSYGIGVGFIGSTVFTICLFIYLFIWDVNSTLIRLSKQKSYYHNRKEYNRRFPPEIIIFVFIIWPRCRVLLKRDGTRAESRFRLSPKRTGPFKSAGVVSSIDCWQPSCARQRLVMLDTPRS